MRHSIKRISKSALSVILALMMVVSTMVVGMVSTSAANGKITVYFKNTVNWSNVYVYFYSSSYWSDSNGSGSNGIAGGPFQMTKVDGTTDIYSYTYTGTYSQYISFTKDSQSGYSNFWQTEAAYRGDFDASKPLYTPETTASGTYNTNVKYYNNGSWSTYSSSGGSDLTYTLNDSNGNTSDFTKTSDGVYETTVSLSANTDYKYYITDNENHYYRNSSGTISSTGGSVTLYRYGSNNSSHYITVKASTAGDYTFKWEYTGAGAADTNGKLTVTYPTISNYTISVAARYQSFNNDSETYNAVSSTLPGDIGATYTVDGGSSATVSAGSPVTLAASTTNTDKYTFAGWYTDAACTNAVGTTTPTPSADTTYYALYQQKFKNVTYNVTGADGTINGYANGTVKKTGVGTEVIVAASDVTGYTSNVTVSGATLSSNKFTVGTSDVTVTATYTPNSHKVTFASLSNGSFDSSTEKTVNYGATVTVQVTPNAGYKVDTVTYGSENATVTYNGVVATATFTMPDSDVEVNATFSKKEYKISDSSDTSKGSVQPKVNGSASFTFNIGDVITFEPTAVDGYELTSYTVEFADGSTQTVNNGDTYSVTIDSSLIGDITVTGTFTEKSYNITYVGDNCTKPANTTAKYNSSVAISDFTANDGYVITGYTVTKTGDTSTSVEITDNSFTMPAYDVTVKATVKKQHTVTVTSGENGSVNPTTATVIDGETVTLTATPDSGYAVDTWTIPSGATLSSGTLKDKVITVTVTDDVTINVSFIESQDIVIYLATPTSWSEWSTMSVTQSISGTSATGNKYIVSSSTSGTSIGCVGGNIGTKNINGSSRMVSYIVLPAECANWTSFYIGNASGGYFCSYQFSGAPQYGYCYYNTSTSDGGYCAATTISSPKANGSDTASCFVNDTVSLTSTVTKANTSSGNYTAGGTTYHVKYIVTDESNNSTELDADVATWTPTTPGTYTITAKLYDDYTTFVSAETATVTVKTKTLSNITATASNATVKITDSSDTEITQAYEGDTVKVTVTPATGYECDGTYTVTPSTLNVSYSDNTFTFTMPGEDVTLTPTVSARKVATVNVASNDDAYGSAALTTTGTIYVGDSFTVKATPATEYVFDSFTVTGATQVAIVKNEDGSTTGTFKATSQNVNVTANFTENSGELTSLYLIYGTSNNPSSLTSSLPVYKLSDGSYVAKFTGVTLEKNTNYYFALSASTSYTNMYWQENSNVPVSSTNTTYVTAEKQHYGLNNVNYYFGYFKIISDQVTDITVLVGNDDGSGNIKQPNYVVTPKVETLPEGTAKVYAKDGTTIDGGTYQYGDTKVVTSDTIKLKSEHTAYNVYSAEKDSYLTIQTTMDSTYSGYGFYVYAFCINGESYPAVAKAGGVYETTYKVTGEEENSIVEITPVYYNTKVEDAGDYISVYVDASQLNGKWGNTISCYSYYYYSGKNAYKTTPYPGQPMLLGTNGLYYTRVPRYAYENGERKVDSEGNPYAVSGVTLNSFSESELHGTLYSYLNGKNYQTYDYDDFKYIADLGFDTVKFVIEYRDGTTNQKTLLNNGNTAPDKSGSTITPSVYEGQNGWDDFYDFDGNKTDILGNVLTAEQQTSSPIYVVSTGNQNTSMGEWSTVWYVYDSSGNYVTQGIPSDFIPRNTDGGSATNTDAYQAIVNAGLTGVPVQICYESEQNASTSTNSGNSGVRVDGRWYYTTSTQDTPVDVIVQYRDDTSQDVWTTDTTGVSGTATIDGVTEKIFTERNVTAQLNAVAKSGYVFVEWGTVDDNGENYTKLSNIKSASAEFMIDTSYHLVARFEKVEDGSLVISHEKYTGPDYVGGGGYYLVSAVVYNADGTVNSTYDLTEGSITIPELASLKDSNCTIEITMVTKMKGENTFIDWYMLTPEGDYDNITQDEAAWGATGEVSQTITVVVDDLYSGSELVVNTLQYYSDIARVTKDAVLNYKYYNRFGEERTYTVTVTLNDTYIEENGYSITDQLIYDNAPAIEDLYKDCIWTITDQSTTKNGTTATIWGTHNEVTYNVTLDDGINPTVAATVKYSKYLTNPDTDAFYTAPAENEGVSFAYWLVEENGKEVARCYANEFNLKILGNYTITAVYANEKDSSLSIVGPTYTREQFTDDAGNVKSDYLYVDFIVAYMNSYGILLNGDLAKDMDYHTGLIIEFDRNIKVTDEDAENATLSIPLTDYAYDDYSGIEDIAKNSDKTSGSLTVDGDRALYKFEIDNAGYNNKNRLDYYVKFNNTKSFRHYVMKAYYYVYYTNDQGEIVYQQTEPVYFCLFEIGNSTADLS